MGMGGRDRCLLGSGEGMRSGVVFAFFFCGLEGRGPCSFRDFLGFPFRLGSASIFRLRREFSCRSASISSALRFFISASSCCIFAWPSRMAARSGVMPAGPEGPASAYLFTPALLRVETIFREKRVLKVFVLCLTVGANCSC